MDPHRKFVSETQQICKNNSLLLDDLKKLRSELTLAAQSFILNSPIIRELDTVIKYIEINGK